MNKLKVTKGKWELVHHKKWNNLLLKIDVISGFKDICDIYYLRDKDDRSKRNSPEEGLANAQLIADAGTTYNKCGLTPSELLDRYKEAVNQLGRLLSAQRGFSVTNQLVDYSQEIINKSKEV